MLGKKNIVILACILVIVLLLVYYFVFRKQKKSTCKIITPQCLLGALTNNSRVLVVNVLSDKMPVFIGIENPDPIRSISKTKFEQILKENNNSVPKDVELVILMCAGWSCSAAKNYCEELNNRGVDVSRVVDYEGGLHEWCLYNKLNSSVFKLFGLENNLELDKNKIGELLKNTAHGYNTNTLIDENKEPVSGFCKSGKTLPELLTIV
jgi:hypothetical protein